MKNLTYIIGSLLIAASWTSCESFLDREPLSQVIDQSTDSTVVVTPADAEAAISAVYAGFKSSQSELFMLDWYLNGDAQSDNAHAGADNPNIFQIDDYRMTATNANAQRDWAYFYGLISTCNNAIEKATIAVNLDQTRRDEIIGEASFVRGFLYFYMAQLWGGVPIITKPIPEISAENFKEVYSILYPDSRTEEEVFQQAIADLELAVSLAPTQYGSTKMRGTKYAAYATLAKVFATKKPVDWTQVNTYCDAVIAGPFSLLPTFEHLWDGQHENSSEAIFEMDCTDWNSGGNWGSSMFVGTDWKKFNTPSHDLVDAYNAIGDSVRRKSTINFRKVTSWTDPYWDINNYPFAYKMRSTTGNQNQIFIRLADIYLLKAEALTELGQLDDASGAQYYLNLVRSRVGLPKTTAYNTQDLRDAIALERRLELAFEGHRWYDLKRTGKAIETMTALGYTLPEYRLLWPIPQSERDKNINLKQNPGY